MDKNNTNLKKQRERLSKVFDYLKERGISQKEIADNTDVDATELSHFKSGKTKHIPNEFLDKLQQAYNINPKYIHLDSDRMIDIIGIKLCNFESFVDSWDTVDRQAFNSKKGKYIEKYLHFTMDKNFYDFLIDTDNARLVTDDGFSSLSDEIKSLKEIFTGKPDLQEFVLIPRNNFISIVTDSVSSRRNFEELIDSAEYEAYLEE